MFPTLNSKLMTTVCVAAMMMMMMMVTTMTEAAAMPRGGGHSKHSHRKSSDGATVETVPLQLDPSALVPTKNVRSLHNVSISPWTYNDTHDESLFPPRLSEARCLLQGCLDSEGEPDLTLESRPIMRQLLLLRRVRGAAGDGYHYRLESRLVAVGCTCVRPTVQRQQ